MRHYGPDHIQVAITLFNLGCACGALGDTGAARSHTLRALIIFTESFGADHAYTAAARTMLASLGGAN